MFKTLELERKGQVATVWMNRPKLHNAFDEVLIAELTEAFEMLGEDESARIVVLGGRGKSFSAGADLNWMKRAAGYSPDENLRDARAMANMLRTLAFLPKPTVARVQGAAIGGGMGLVAACDIAIASTEAVFATSEVKFGIIPAAVGPHVIAAIGERQARRFFLTAERIDARCAVEIGLVHEAVEPGELDGKLKAVLEALLAGGPKSQAAAKELIRAVTGKPLDGPVIEDTALRIARIRATPEAGEGIGAFLEKRSPAWLPGS